MKDLIRKISAAIGTSLLVLLPFSILAAELPDVRGPAEQAASGLPGTGGEGSLTGFIGGLVSAALGLLGVVFFVLIIYGGALWMTAQGDTAKVDKAKKILLSAVIGLAVVMAAYAISYYVVGAIAGSTGLG